MRAGRNQCAAGISEPAREKDAERRPRHGGPLWATLGFACGAVLWHVTSLGAQDAMPPPSVAGSLPVTAPPEAGSQTAVYHVAEERCSALVLDRAANRTTLRPCPAEGLALRLEAAGGRADRELAMDAERLR